MISLYLITYISQAELLDLVRIRLKSDLLTIGQIKTLDFFDPYFPHR